MSNDGFSLGKCSIYLFEFVWSFFPGYKFLRLPWILERFSFFSKVEVFRSAKRCGVRGDWPLMVRWAFVFLDSIEPLFPSFPVWASAGNSFDLHFLDHYASRDALFRRNRQTRDFLKLVIPFVLLDTFVVSDVVLPKCYETFRHG